MRKFLFFLILLCIEKTLHAQQPYVYTIKADSVKITNTCDTAELIIENHTQTIPGFLFNKGRGRTEFRRIAQLDDTSVVVGGDTIHLGRGSKNFANADLTFDGDHWHDGALHNVSLYNFGQIGFQTNNADFNASTDMRMNPVDGYSLYISDNRNSDPEQNFTAEHSIGNGYMQMNVTGRKSGLFTGSQFLEEKSGWLLSTDATNFQTGESYYGSLSYGINPDEKNGAMEIVVDNGPMKIFSRDFKANIDRWLEVKLNYADSITFSTVTHFDTVTRFTQTRTGFTFNRLDGINDFRVLRLPASTSATDSMLVIDNYGQVKKRPQTSARKSVTVTAGTYTVPADVDVVFVNYTGGTATITLPSGTLDREITIKNLNTTNSVALSGLDASESNSIATRGAITVKYTGSAWVGISKY